MENLYDEIANLLNNFDSKIQTIENNSEYDEIEEAMDNRNDFGDVLVELSTKDSLNPKGIFFYIYNYVKFI